DVKPPARLKQVDPVAKVPGRKEQEPSLLSQGRLQMLAISEDFWRTGDLDILAAEQWRRITETERGERKNSVNSAFRQLGESGVRIDDILRPHVVRPKTCTRVSIETAAELRHGFPRDRQPCRLAVAA